MSDPAYILKFDRFIVPVMGFSQSTVTLTGIEKAWRICRRWSSSTTCIITPRAWDDDWEALASFIARNAATDPVINIVGFSWGAGGGAMTLARELQKLNLSVNCMVLADPVYRNPSVPTWLNPRALMNSVFAPSIKVPANVREVRWTRQFNDKPQGHRLKAEDPAATNIHPAKVRDLGHSDMDDDPLFQSLVMDAFGA